MEGEICFILSNSVFAEIWGNTGGDLTAHFIIRLWPWIFPGIAHKNDINRHLLKLTNYSSTLPVLPYLNSLLTTMRYDCPTFKMMKSRMRAVKEHTSGLRGSCKFGLKPMSVWSLRIYTVSIFTVSVSSLAVLNGEVHSSAQKGPEGQSFRQVSGSVIYNSVSLSDHPKLRNWIHGALIEGHAVHQPFRTSKFRPSAGYKHTGPSNTSLLNYTLGVLPSADVEKQPLVTQRSVI